jgi:hypothetical protein
MQPESQKIALKKYVTVKAWRHCKHFHDKSDDKTEAEQRMYSREGEGAD